MSSDLFADYAPGNIRGGSVGCSHLNQWLAACKSGATSNYDDMCDSPNKTISARRVVESSVTGPKELEDAINFGLTFTMFKAKMELDYPDLPSIIARGLNTEHHIAEGHITHTLQIDSENL